MNLVSLQVYSCVRPNSLFLIPAAASAPSIKWKVGIGHTNPAHFLSPDYCRQCSISHLSGFRIENKVSRTWIWKKNPYTSNSSHEETFYEIPLIHASFLPTFSLLLTMIHNSVILYSTFAFQPWFTSMDLQVWVYSRTCSISMDFPKRCETDKRSIRKWSWI